MLGERKGESQPEMGDAVDGHGEGVDIRGVAVSGHGGLSKMTVRIRLGQYLRSRVQHLFPAKIELRIFNDLPVLVSQGIEQILAFSLRFLTSPGYCTENCLA